MKMRNHVIWMKIVESIFDLYGIPGIEGGLDKMRMPEGMAIACGVATLAPRFISTSNHGMIEGDMGNQITIKIIKIKFKYISAQLMILW